MKPTDSAEELLEVTKKPEVVTVAATIRQVAGTVFHEKFPGLKPIDIGFGILTGGIAFLQNHGTSNATVADILRRMAATLEKNLG
jgi:hypothetical protein